MLTARRAPAGPAADANPFIYEALIGELPGDIGLPVHELAPIIRSILSGEPVESTDHGVVLGAANRRGRQVTVTVSYGPLASADRPGGVIVAMDELEAG
ncbi:MAG TPA: hypothetical protein VMF65_25540 [Acidimicrobiales bacterium]|nr:hypothetical protein [Acidimicrobiales bacterium]